MAIGDSKTVQAPGWLEDLWEISNNDGSVRFEMDLPKIAQGGWSVPDVFAVIDAQLASRTTSPDYVLINLGANDTAFVPGNQAEWKTDLAYILDALRTKWPSVQVYLMRVWIRGADAAINLMADTLIPDVISTRPWAHLGPDERIFLENGDNGTTYTTDGVHPTTAGYMLEAQQWKTVLGL